MRYNKFIAIRLQDGSYLLNGNNFINWSGEYKGAGTTFVYRRQSPQNLESFSAAGPLQESIDVMVSNMIDVNLNYIILFLWMPLIQRKSTFIANYRSTIHIIINICTNN